jgi:hypothetical protein
VNHAVPDLVVGVWQKSAVICPTIEPKSYQMTSTEPINSRLIHNITSWHFQMMIINDFGKIIWPMWITLCQILWSGFDKNQLWFAQLLSQNPTRWHPQNQSIPC